MTDPITLALFQNRLDYVARQMGWVMIRTARSPIFNQAHDFSCFVADEKGSLVSQADGIPIHTGGGGFAIRALLGAFGDDIADGDVFVLNDPYVAGGNHLPDWVIARPVFSSLISSRLHVTAPTSRTSAAAPREPTIPPQPRFGMKGCGCRRCGWWEKAKPTRICGSFSS